MVPLCRLGLPGYKHIRPAYWRAFIDEYTQEYSLIPRATLMNIPLCICDKALVGMV